MGAASRRLMEEALQQQQRALIVQRFLSGAWGLELEDFEADRRRDQERDQAMVR
jgi:hypothetical protein